MGADVFAARSDLLGARADDILGFGLAELVANGPEDELTRTDRAQPALFALSFALWDELRNAVDTLPVAAAGHSLGEYTALAASGALDYDEGLRLVAERGRAMNDAAALAPSGMAALLGADFDVAGRIAAKRRDAGGHLWVANLNAPGQVVLAGGEADITWLVAEARALGARRAVPLKVAGAFHSPFMEPAAAELAAAVGATKFHQCSFPVFANATADVVSDPAMELVTQLTSPVRFAESLIRMADAGVSTFVHVGPGDVTAGLARRTVPEARTMVVSAIGDVDAVARELSVQ